MINCKTRTIRPLIEPWWAIALIIALVISWHLEATANDLNLPPPASDVQINAKVHARLQSARQMITATKADRFSQEQIQDMAARGVTLREDGKVLVELIGPDDDEILDMVDFDGLESIGLETGIYIPEMTTDESPEVKSVEKPLTVSGNRAEAWIPLGQINQAAASLPEGYLIKPVGHINYDDVPGQGPVVTNSDSYSAYGHSGDGLTIAIIDGGFNGLSAAITNGDAPSAYTAINYASGGFESGVSTHGTGCVEAVYDHAPDAAYRIYRINSVTDLATAVTDAVANGVDIISHSISWYNLGWSDNSGTACSAANNASNNGILFFTSAGNRADSHYQGIFTDSDEDGWHEFAPGDEQLDITISPAENGNYYLSWSNADNDLDFYLYNARLNTVVASSVTVGDGVFEDFYYDNPNDTDSFYLAVYRRSGTSINEIEIFSHNAGSWQEHIVARGSTTSPSNSTGALVLSVGAVSHGSFGQPNNSNVIESYSSRGPSNSGMTLPDITGPTNTTGFTYSRGFGGTSCATPNAAGATGAFWSSNTALSGYAIQWLFKEQADLWRDWGTSGVDNTYGKGGLFLTDYQYGTRWAARSYPGTADSPSVPYHTVTGAIDAVPNNGRLLIYGSSYGSFPEAVVMGETGNAATIEVVDDSGPAILGE